MAKLARVLSPMEGMLIKKDERKKAAAKMAGMQPKTPVAALPDEEELQRKSRKDAAKRFGARGSGRASTILSSDEGRLGA